jgi:hypothetical protein
VGTPCALEEEQQGRRFAVAWKSRWKGPLAGTRRKAALGSCAGKRTETVGNTMGDPFEIRVGHASTICQTSASATVVVEISLTPRLVVALHPVKL